MLHFPAVTGGDPQVAPQAIEWLMERALKARRPPKSLWSLSLAAPLAFAERLLRLPGRDDGFLFSTAADAEHSGVGAAHLLSGDGASCFDEVREGGARLFADLGVLSLDGSPAPAPRLVGGFAFNPQRPRTTIWQGFGAARFLLPRVAYTRHAARAWLTLTASARELASASGRRRLATEAGQALELLGSPAGRGQSDLPAPFRRGMAPLRIEESLEHWASLVVGIRAEIAAGRLEKAVAARRVIVRGAGLPHPSVVLERLRREAPGCTRFALAVGPKVFLGASPECLVRLFGGQVSAEALAGSMPRAARDARGTLLRSVKESAEHAIVVRELRATLGPLCSRLDSDEPLPLRLRHLLHLRTRFVGVLKAPRHVLDLVAALHPTPAVGGTPRGAALPWLDSHEHADRGFFAGPFGGFDANGDGHFIVAIRSGLLCTEVAHLYAGAGIVAGSDPSRELAETRWKLRSLLVALGVA